MSSIRASEQQRCILKHLDIDEQSYISHSIKSQSNKSSKLAKSTKLKATKSQNSIKPILRKETLKPNPTGSASGKCTVSQS